MDGFKNQITLARNSRGCYILDTVKGCSGCNKERPRGCYGDCYAWNIASRYGRDFSRIVKRDFAQDYEQARLFEFDDSRHTSDILRAISEADMPFIRIGELGDPSEDWEHTLNVCKIITNAGKKIVIITKHWKSIPESLLFETKGLYINTSISALDTDAEIKHRLTQYERLGKYCNSILRVVSCDFNTGNEEGTRRAKIQEYLLSIKPHIDTVFRPNKSNSLISSGIINVKKIKFLRNTMLASMHDENIYMGVCDNCPDMCGLTLGDKI
jgi:hypothetical protein